MPLRDEITVFLTEMAASGAKPIEQSTPGEVRALSADLKELYGAGPEMARVEEHTVSGADGGSFVVRVFVPAGTPRAVVIYFHGGGWVIGAIDEFDTLARKLAARTGCAVVLPDYRLAPEYRYPTAVDDAYATLEWVAEHVGDIAGSEVPIVVAGDSAGGNLSAVTAQRARDRGGPAVALQALVYPVTDADVDNASYRRDENQLMVTRDGMIWFWDHYAPDEAQRKETDASPLQAEDLSGLPPAVVILAEYDVLRDEGQAYADRLQQAGVPVEVHVHPGQMHGFFTLLMLPGHDEAIDQLNASLDTHLGAATTS